MKKLIFIISLGAFLKTFCVEQNLLGLEVEIVHECVVRKELENLKIYMHLLPAQSEQLIKNSCNRRVSIKTVLAIIEALCEPTIPLSERYCKGYKMLLVDIFLRYQPRQVTYQVKQIFNK